MNIHSVISFVHSGSKEERKGTIESIVMVPAESKNKTKENMDQLLRTRITDVVIDGKRYGDVWTFAELYRFIKKMI